MLSPIVIPSQAALCLNSEHMGNSAGPAARDSRERSALDIAFDVTTAPMALVNGDGHVLRANRALAELLGYVCNDLIGVNLTRICSWIDGEPAADATARVELKSRNSAAVHGRARLTSTRVTDGPALVFIVVGLCETANLRATHSYSELIEVHVQIARSLLDQTSEAVVVHYADGTIRHWSSSAERMFGVPAEQAVGKTYADLLGPGAEMADEEKTTLLSQGSWSGELPCVLPSGQIVLVERQCRLVRHAHSVSFLSMNVDIGERYRAEKESELVRNLFEQRMKNQTAQLREKADDLRDLSYSIAHDLRAPLTSIDGFTAQLEKRLARSVDETTRHYLRRVRAGVDTLNQMTSALLALAAVADAKLAPQAVDISALARRVSERLCAEAGREIDVSISDTATPIVDLALVKTLLEQLLGNSLKFTRDTQNARITFDSQTSEHGVCVFRLADNGTGFDPAYAYKLFAPFQRLHSANEAPGIGIGLALARKIVARHGGRIWAVSTPGEGTSVFFTFHDLSAGDDAVRVKIAEDVSRWERFRAADLTG